MTNFGKLLILACWALMLANIVTLLGINVYLTLNGTPDNTMTQWGSVTQGFLFGTFPTMVKEFLNLKGKE